jgi:hypothetical protein
MRFERNGLSAAIPDARFGGQAAYSSSLVCTRCSLTDSHPVTHSSQIPLSVVFSTFALQGLIPLESPSFSRIFLVVCFIPRDFDHLVRWWQASTRGQFPRMPLSSTRFYAWRGPHCECLISLPRSSPELWTRSSLARDLWIAMFTDVHAVGSSRFGNG